MENKKNSIFTWWLAESIVIWIGWLFQLSHNIDEKNRPKMTPAEERKNHKILNDKTVNC